MDPELEQSIRTFFSTARIFIEEAFKKKIIDEEDFNILCEKLEDIYPTFAKNFVEIKAQEGDFAQVITPLIEFSQTDRFTNVLMGTYTKELKVDEIYLSLVLSTVGYIGEYDFEKVREKVKKLDRNDCRLVFLFIPIQYELYKRGINVI
ncbi:MAG: hypothetical protein ACE5K4_09080 [Candidatus Hydrothermarchaeota archaeon]